MFFSGSIRNFLGWVFGWLAWPSSVHFRLLAVKISFRLSENFEKPKAKGMQETKNERNERKQIK